MRVCVSVCVCVCVCVVRGARPVGKKPWFVGGCRRARRVGGGRAERERRSAEEG